jgi:hypothetical protein
MYWHCASSSCSSIYQSAALRRLWLPVKFRPGAPFSGEWFRGNSRPHRSRICEPWRCKSSLAHHSLPGRLISRTPPFEGGCAGAIPAPAANFDRSRFDRSVVKQDHGWPTPSNRRGSTFPSDHFHLPRGAIRSASVSETEGLGAKPGEAASSTPLAQDKCGSLTNGNLWRVAGKDCHWHEQYLP